MVAADNWDPAQCVWKLWSSARVRYRRPRALRPGLELGRAELI